jgi:hypothetical protein
VNYEESYYLNELNSLSEIRKDFDSFNKRMNDLFTLVDEVVKVREDVLEKRTSDPQYVAK